MDHGARSHAKYSGSIAHRFPACPGSVAYCATLPEPFDSEAAERGTAAHEYLDFALRYSIAYAEVVIGKDPEIIDAVSHVMDFLERIAVSHGRGETYSEIPQIFPQAIVSPDECASIADLMVYYPNTGELFSIEFKFGVGHAVEVERNPQLMFNAVAFAWDKPVSRVNLVVIQPRLTWHRDGTTREWSCDGTELVAFQREIEAAIVAAEKPDAPLIAGPHCRFCPAEPFCPAREASALSVANLPVPADWHAWAPPPLASLGLDRLVQIDAHADDIVAWVRSVSKFLDAMARDGGQVPGHKLVEAGARRRIQGGDPLAAAHALAQLAPGLTPADFLDVKVKGVGDVEVAVVRAARGTAAPGQAGAAAKAAKDRLAFLTVKESSGTLSRVPISDPRPAADRSATAFKGITLPPMPGV